MHKGLATADLLKYYTSFRGLPDNIPTFYSNPFDPSSFLPCRRLLYNLTNASSRTEELHASRPVTPKMVAKHEVGANPDYSFLVQKAQRRQSP